MNAKTKQTFFHQVPDSSIIGSVFRLAIRDVKLIKDRIKTARRANEAFGYRDSIRFSSDELCEAMISIASTSSLIGYRRDGEDWRLQCCNKNSAHALDILHELGELRSELVRNEFMIRKYLISNRGAEASLRRSIALMCLSLDAVSAPNMIDFQSIAGVSISSLDPVGDAQFYSEEMEKRGAIPLKPENIYL